jgi:hypothetical protein
MRRDVSEATDCRTHEIEPWQTVSSIPSAEGLVTRESGNPPDGQRQGNDRASEPSGITVK